MPVRGAKEETMITPAQFTHALLVERDGLAAWINENAGKPRTARFHRSLRAHRLVTDLIVLRGGSPAERAYVMRELAAIEQGQRDVGAQ